MQIMMLGQNFSLKPFFFSPRRSSNFAPYFILYTLTIQEYMYMAIDDKIILLQTILFDYQLLSN